MNDGVTRPRGKTYKHGKLHFFAENGLVRIEDQTTGEYKSMNWKDALLRARGMNAAATHVPYADEKLEMVRCVENLIECAREAKNMGSPFDEGVGKQRKRDLPLSIIPGDGLSPFIPKSDLNPTHFLQPNKSKRIIVPDDVGSEALREHFKDGAVIPHKKDLPDDSI